MGSKHRLARTKRNWEKRIERAQWAADFVSDWGFWNSKSRVEDGDLLAQFATIGIEAWRANYRTIYEVDPDLLDELIDSEVPDQEIPASIFRHIPHNVPLFVLPQPLEVVHEDMTALYGQFMVVPVKYLDWSEGKDQLDSTTLNNLFAMYKVNKFEDLPDAELLPRMIRVSRADQASEIKFIWFGHNIDDIGDQIITTQTIHLDGDETVDLGAELKELLSDIYVGGSKAYVYQDDRGKIERDKHWGEVAKKQFSVATALTLYVCSEEPDIMDVDPPEELFGVKGTYKSTISVKNLGIRIGSALRKHRIGQASTDGPGLGRHMVPHIRKAHWHRFWTGPRDGDRKLVIRWLPPIPVNIDKGEIIPTIRPVKESV